MPGVPSDIWELEAGLHQMMNGWDVSQAVFWLMAVAAIILLLGVTGATLLHLRDARHAH